MARKNLIIKFWKWQKCLKIKSLDMPQPAQAFQLFLDFFDSTLFLVLQIAGGFISVILIVSIVILIYRGGSFATHMRHLWIAWNASPLPKSRMVKRWLAIKGAMEKDDSGGWRTAIIDADSMLDEVVAKLGYKGDTLEERLKNAVEYQFPSLENAWRAHQISDFLKEDSSYVLTREVAEQTIEIYRTIFTETGIIL